MTGTPDSKEDALSEQDSPPVLQIPSELIKDIPEEQRDQLIKYVRQSLHVEHFSGPLPPPSVLSQYEYDVQKVIVDEAVENRVHRTVLESRGQMMYFAREILGLLFGFVLALSLIVGGLQSVLAGRSGEGLVGIGGTVVLVVGAFLYTDHKKRSERNERQLQNDQSTDLDLSNPESDGGKREKVTPQGTNA